MLCAALLRSFRGQHSEKIKGSARGNWNPREGQQPFQSNPNGARDRTTTLRRLLIGAASYFSYPVTSYFKIGFTASSKFSTHKPTQYPLKKLCFIITLAVSPSPSLQWTQLFFNFDIFRNGKIKNLSISACGHPTWTLLITISPILMQTLYTPCSLKTFSLPTTPGPGHRELSTVYVHAASEGRD